MCGMHVLGVCCVVVVYLGDVGMCCMYVMY